MVVCFIDKIGFDYSVKTITNGGSTKVNTRGEIKAGSGIKDEVEEARNLLPRVTFEAGEPKKILSTSG